MFLPKDNDLGMQIDLPRLAGAVLDQRDQLQDIVRCRATIVDDKIAVYFGNARRPHGKILEAKLVDQLACGQINR